MIDKQLILGITAFVIVILTIILITRHFKVSQQKDTKEHFGECTLIQGVTNNESCADKCKARDEKDKRESVFAAFKEVPEADNKKTCVCAPYTDPDCTYDKLQMPETNTTNVNMVYLDKPDINTSLNMSTQWNKARMELLFEDIAAPTANGFSGVQGYDTDKFAKIYPTSDVSIWQGWRGNKVDSVYSAEDCMNKCASSDNCMSFLYHPDDNIKCVHFEWVMGEGPFHRTITKKPNHKGISGNKIAQNGTPQIKGYTEVAKGYPYVDNLPGKGRDVTSPNVIEKRVLSSLDHCAKACDIDPKCKAIWYKKNECMTFNTPYTTDGINFRFVDKGAIERDPDNVGITANKRTQPVFLSQFSDVKNSAAASEQNDLLKSAKNVYDVYSCADMCRNNKECWSMYYDGRGNICNMYKQKFGEGSVRESFAGNRNEENAYGIIANKASVHFQEYGFNYMDGNTCQNFGISSTSYDKSKKDEMVKYDTTCKEKNIANTKTNIKQELNEMIVKSYDKKTSPENTMTTLTASTSLTKSSTYPIDDIDASKLNTGDLRCSFDNGANKYNVFCT